MKAYNTEPGAVLRIDLQGDKSKTSRRGFILRYTITRDTPGLRAQRKITSSSDNTSGKVNFNTFKSTQQRMINNAGSQGPLKRKYKVPKKLIYGSETTTPKPQTTTDPNGGWLGDGRLAPIKPSKKGSNGKARPKPPPPGARIQAMNQRNQRRPNSNQNSPEPNNRNNAGNRIQYAGSQQSNGWADAGGDQAAEPAEPVRIYGQDLQPRNSALNKKKDERKRPTNNYVVVNEDEGITTEQLIIIIVGVMACILVLLLGIFLLKKFCFDKKTKEEKKEEIDENPYCVDHETTLPGISGTGSLHSVTSIYEHTAKSRHASVAPTSHRGTMSRKTLTNEEMTRHQSLVAQHEALYRNHIAMMKRGSPPEGLQRRPSLGSRSNINRPLPPIPGKKRDPKLNDVDEDYFSGSDLKDDVKTMKRERSEWEIQEEKRNKIKNRYVLRN